MELTVNILKIEREPSHFVSGVNSWVITGKKYHIKFSITLGEEEWRAVNEAHDKPLQPGDDFIIEIPGKQPVYEED